MNTIKVFINRISNGHISPKHHIGHGCGRIISKCRGWAKSLHRRNCRLLIVLHDSDFENPALLYKKILNELNDSPIENYLICIPVQELEAWLLSDPIGIRDAMRLKSLPKVNGKPQNIRSPKEYLGQIINKYSAKTKIYINTKHNEVIANHVAIQEILKKCDSFRSFHEFVVNYIN